MNLPDIFRNRQKKRPRDPQDRVKDLFQNRRIAIADFHYGSRGPRYGYGMALWNWVAATIDGLIVFSFCCFFLLVFALIVKTNFVQMKHLVQGSLWSFAILNYFCFAALYTIVLRLMNGRTIGEWACGLSLGSSRDRLASNYSLRVCLRTLIVFGTGLLTIPLASLFVRKDLAGVVSGLVLVRQSVEK